MKISPEQINQSSPIETNAEGVVGLVGQKQEETDSILPLRCDDDVANERIDAGLDIDYIIRNLRCDGIKCLYLERVIKTLARLVIELENRILSYDTIISDDASGRSVSLFLREVINIKKAENGDKESIKTFFIACGKPGAKNDEAVKDFIIRRSNSFGKVLLVTEYIESGLNIKSIADKLEKYGIEFDIATLSIRKRSSMCTRSYDYYLDYACLKKIEGRLIYGEEGTIGKIFYDQPFNGVKKDSGSYNHYPVKNNESEQSEINESRKDMKFLAKQISKLI